MPCFEISKKKLNETNAEFALDGIQKHSFIHPFIHPSKAKIKRIRKSEKNIKPKTNKVAN